MTLPDARDIEQRKAEMRRQTVLAAVAWDIWGNGLHLAIALALGIACGAYIHAFF